MGYLIDDGSNGNGHGMSYPSDEHDDSEADNEVDPFDKEKTGKAHVDAASRTSLPDSIRYEDENRVPRRLNLKNVQDEIKIIRDELHDLKDCQTRYFTYSVTSTALLLGLGKTATTSIDRGFVYLTPLVVILPVWIVFFDKASSITRAVGYLRVLECILYHEKTPVQYYGWERALETYRNKTGRYEAQEKRKTLFTLIQSIIDNLVHFYKLKVKLGQLWSLINELINNKQYHYWAAIYVTFFVLPLLCIIFSSFEIYPSITTELTKHVGFMDTLTFLIPLAALAIFVLVFYITVRKLHFITLGDGSYNNREYLWSELIFGEGVVGHGTKHDTFRLLDQERSTMVTNYLAKQDGLLDKNSLYRQLPRRLTESTYYKVFSHLERNGKIIVKDDKVFLKPPPKEVEKAEAEPVRPLTNS